MAFWQRKRGRQVVVFIFEGGKQQQLPRDLTRHLDHEPDHNIDYWVKDWEARNGKALAEVRPTDPQLQGRIDSYAKYLASRRKSPKTISDHRHHLSVDVATFFVGIHKITDPNAWTKVAAKLSAWMREAGRSEFQIQKANSALRGFWRWLGDEGIVLSGIELRLRTPIREATPTPLARLVKPTEVLDTIRRASRPEIKLMAIFGYFFSLRPQETMALRPMDLVAGSAAGKLESCQTAARLGLFGRLAVNVHRQRLQSGDFGPPKAHSVGYVACFDETAARALVDLLRGADREALLFTHQNDWLFELWKRHGINGITLKDLRRASCYWLGHSTRFGEEPLSAMKHMRHKDFETTLGYLRRPGEQADAPTVLDLDA